MSITIKDIDYFNTPVEDIVALWVEDNPVAWKDNEAEAEKLIRSLIRHLEWERDQG